MPRSAETDVTATKKPDKGKSQVSEINSESFDLNAPAPHEVVMDTAPELVDKQIRELIGFEAALGRKTKTVIYRLGKALFIRRQQLQKQKGKVNCGWGDYVKEQYGICEKTAYNWTQLAGYAGLQEPASETPEPHKATTKGKSKGKRREFHITDARLQIGKVSAAVESLTKEILSQRFTTKEDKGVAREVLADIRKKVNGTTGLEGQVAALKAAIEVLADKVK